MNRMVILLLVAIAGVTAEELVAVVRLAPHSPDKIVTGELTLTQSEENGPVKVSGAVYGLTEGLHGFHVHEKGDLREGCNSTGGHFNPHKQTHGAPEDDVRHVGDLGNIKANSEGVATINITDRLISLSGPHNVIGRAIVVHAKEDDLGAGNSTLSATTGDAGERWACGIIGILSPTGSWNNSGSFTSPSMSVLLIPLLAAVFLQRQKI